MPGAVVTIHIDPDEPGIMDRGARDRPQRETGLLHLHKH